MTIAKDIFCRSDRKIAYGERVNHIAWSQRKTTFSPIKRPLTPQVCSGATTEPRTLKRRPARVLAQFKINLQKANRPSVLMIKAITLLKNQGNKGTSLRERKQPGGKGIIKNLNEVRTSNVPTGKIKFFRKTIRAWRVVI